MKNRFLQQKDWQRCAWLLATAVVLVLLASHPELRALIPVVDAMGLDILVLVVGSQLWDYTKPYLQAIQAKVVLPLAKRAYSILLFFFGYLGTYVDARVRLEFSDARR